MECKRLSISAPLVLLLLVLVPAEAASSVAFNVTLLVTRSVRGAISRVDGWGGACDMGDGADLCACDGGADRRQTVLEQGREGNNTLVVDTGAYFYGSGLFFPSFRGDASRDLFAAAGPSTFRRALV